jgi:uncharacterized protein YceK
MPRFVIVLVCVLIVGCGGTERKADPKKTQELIEAAATMMAMENATKAKSKTDEAAAFWPIVLQNAVANKTAQEETGFPVTMTMELAKTPYEWSRASASRSNGPGTDSSTIGVELWGFVWQLPWFPVKDISSRDLKSEAGKKEFIEWTCDQKTTNNISTMEFRFRLMK